MRSERDGVGDDDELDSCGSSGVEDREIVVGAFSLPLMLLEGLVVALALARVVVVVRLVSNTASPGSECARKEMDGKKDAIPMATATTPRTAAAKVRVGAIMVGVADLLWFR